MTENPLPYLNELGKELNMLRLKQAANEHLIDYMHDEIFRLKGLLAQCLEHPVRPEVIAKVKKAVKYE